MSNTMMAETGKPGRPMTGVFPIMERRVGFPGLTSTPWKTMPGLNSARTSYTISPSPADVLPLVMTASFSAESSATVFRIASLSSLTIPWYVAWNTGYCLSMDCTAAPLDSYSRPGIRWLPGSSSSFPVESTAIRIFLLTVTELIPTECSTAISLDPTVVPALRMSSPLERSDPACEMFSPGSTDLNTSRVSPFWRVYSTMMTESAPTGTTAPVAILMHVPGACISRAGSPMDAEPAILSITGVSCSAPSTSCDLTANPSTSDLSKGGESMPENMSESSTLPLASTASILSDPVMLPILSAASLFASSIPTSL